MEIINANYQYTTYLFKTLRHVPGHSCYILSEGNSGFFLPSILNSIKKIHSPQVQLWHQKNAVMTESWIITSACYDKKAYLWQNNKPCQKGINRRQKRRKGYKKNLECRRRPPDPNSKIDR